jgi:hypothetical protein
MKRILFGASMLIAGIFASENEYPCGPSGECNEVHHICDIDNMCREKLDIQIRGGFEHGLL